MHLQIVAYILQHPCRSGDQRKNARKGGKPGKKKKKRKLGDIDAKRGQIVPPYLTSEARRSRKARKKWGTWGQFRVTNLYREGRWEKANGLPLVGMGKRKEIKKGLATPAHSVH